VEYALKREELKKPFMEYLFTLKDNTVFQDLYNEVAFDIENKKSI
jgi:UTP--glucose-1-phosphate uridylyltransferase